MRRAVPLLLTVPVLAVLLAGCGGEPLRNPDEPAIVGPGAAGDSAAIGLVDLWRVEGAAGEEPDTWLRIDAGEFQLWRDCGMTSGSWRATETLFLAHGYAGHRECLPFRIPWLEATTGYRATEGGWDLLDADGAVTASLTIDGAPDPHPDAADFFTRPPEVTEQVRAALQRPAALPAGLDPATAEGLLGKWVPVAHAVSTDPHVVFERDGTWTGSDGCNGGEGRWAVDSDGAFLATSGPQTLIGCEGAPVPGWVAAARIAGFDGEWVKLFDVEGTEIARLQRG